MYFASFQGESTIATRISTTGTTYQKEGRGVITHLKETKLLLTEENMLSSAKELMVGIVWFLFVTMETTILDQQQPITITQ